MNWRNDIKRPIKLVIWDLDDTIWAGTLAENDIVKLYPHVKQAIEKLNDRGIINAICSKNDYNIAKAKLQSFGLWDQFVFPSIDFTSKGLRVANLIADMQLCTANVLFVDDDDSEIKEVKYYNREINVLHSTYTFNMLENSFLKGNSDHGLNRLEQYKQLEKAKKLRKNISNDDFLRAINIKVRFVDCMPETFDRIYELIERTNQLNFTKNRQSRNELENILLDQEVTAKCIQVIDDFGDKGLVGFYAIKNHKLIHFLFSCRIMNMGIEQWVYEQLNYPELEVVGNVASKLTKYTSAHKFIQQIDYNGSKKDSDTLNKMYLNDLQQTTIYAIGACDLFSMIGNLSTPCNKIVIDSNIYKGNFRSVNVGTEYIRSCFEMSDDEKDFCIKHFYNYTNTTTFKPKIFSAAYDYVLFSFVDDFTYPIWKKKNSDTCRIIRCNEPVFDENFTIYSKDDEIEWLNNYFEEPYLISKERFYDNLQWIRSKLPQDTAMLLLNGPEYNFFRLSKKRNERHDKIVNKQIKDLNEVLKQFAIENQCNVRLVDVNKYISHISDFTDFLFHWTSIKCYEIAKECLLQMSGEGIRRSYDFFNNIPIGNRKIILWGNGDYADLCYYSLIANGTVIHGRCCNEIVGYREFGFEPYMILMGKKNDYYVIVVDEGNFDEIRKLLKQYEYEEYIDFIKYQRTALPLNHTTEI